MPLVSCKSHGWTQSMVCVVTSLVTLFACGETYGWESVSKATSSRAARQEAINSIPFDELTQASQRKLIKVLNKPTIYRKLPVEKIQCDPELYLFLVRYPEVVVDIWKLMGATQLGAERTGPFSMNAVDGAGTECKVELVYGTSKTHIFYAEGSYTGSMIRGKLDGRCVLILHTDYQRGPTGRTIISNQLDVFVQIDNGAVDLVARTLSPLIGKSADQNFVEATRFISKLSHSAETNGPGVVMMSYRLKGVDANVRSGFAKMVDGVKARTAQRMDVRTPTERKLVSRVSRQSASNRTE